MENAPGYWLKKVKIRKYILTPILKPVFTYTRIHIILHPTPYTATLKSLNASFKLVFRSVDGFLVPMINAQGTL